MSRKKRVQKSRPAMMNRFAVVTGSAGRMRVFCVIVRSRIVDMPVNAQIKIAWAINRAMAYIQ